MRPVAVVEVLVRVAWLVVGVVRGKLGVVVTSVAVGLALLVRAALYRVVVRAEFSVLVAGDVRLRHVGMPIRRDSCRPGTPFVYDLGDAGGVGDAVVARAGPNFRIEVVDPQRDVRPVAVDLVPVGMGRRGRWR